MSRLIRWIKGGYWINMDLRYHEGSYWEQVSKDFWLDAHYDRQHGVRGSEIYLKFEKYRVDN